MRNWRDLSEDEIKELEVLYPVTTNRELSHRFNVSIDGIQDHIAYPRGWRKNRSVILSNSSCSRRLTESEVQWIVKHYHNTKNEVILCKLGIGEASLHRVARKYGLTKTKRYMRKTQREATMCARVICVRHGLYEDLSEKMKAVAAEYKARGERVPHSFEPGVSNKERIGARRFKKSMEKAAATMREIRRKERIRMGWGLPQKTKLNLKFNGFTKEDHRSSVHRSLFRRYGYMVGRGDDTVYYDDNTVRHLEAEANAHLFGLKVVHVNSVAI